MFFSSFVRTINMFWMAAGIFAYVVIITAIIVAIFYGFIKTHCPYNFLFIWTSYTLIAFGLSYCSWITYYIVWSIAILGSIVWSGYILF